MIALRDGIELMVVTVSAFERQSQPGHSQRAYTVRYVLDAILLVDDSALGVNHVVASETGGDAVIEGRVGHQVTG